MYEYLVSFICENALFVVLPLLGLYILFFKGKISIFQPAKETGVTQTTCTNPNCVRCRTYRDVLDLAKERLDTCAANYPKEAVNRLRSSLDDVNCQLEPADSELSCPTVFQLEGLKTVPWWSTNNIPEVVSKLEENFEAILQEFNSIYENEDGWTTNTTSTGSWSVYHLINQGSKIEENATSCPRTTELVQSLSDVMASNVFGNVAFSVVDPGTIITEHYGPTNIKLRCHLGLVTPSRCSITVAGVCKQWPRGQCLVFDDSHLHSVEYADDATETAGTMAFRAVLIVDVWHPDISVTERSLLDEVFCSNTEMDEK